MRAESQEDRPRASKTDHGVRRRILNMVIGTDRHSLQAWLSRVGKFVRLGEPVATALVAQEGGAGEEAGIVAIGRVGDQWQIHHATVPLPAAAKARLRERSCREQI